MNVLDGLRAGGRLVGIVSQVSELRQRIPARPCPQVPRGQPRGDRPRLTDHRDGGVSVGRVVRGRAPLAGSGRHA